MSDSISREEVLRMIITAGEVEPDLGYTHLHKVVENLPSAEPTGRWTSCSERLPSEDGRYLVTYPLFVLKNKWVNVLWYGKPSMPNIKVKGKCWYCSDDEYGDVVYDDVLAWMPIPEPYKGGDEDED